VRAAPAIALALAVCAASGAARANPADAFGLGSRGIGMGGAQTAAVDDTSANYYNPAALARSRDLRIDLGYRYAQPLLNLNGRDVGINPTRGLSAGILVPGALGPVRFAFGAVVWLPDQWMTRQRWLPYGQPRFVYYDNRTQRFLLSANLAVRLAPGLYIGAGLTFMSRTAGTVNLQGTVALGDPDTSSLVSKIDVDLLAVRYPQAGILWEVTSYLTLGVSYRHSFTLVIDQLFRIDGNIGSPPVVTNGFFSTRSVANDLFQPWQLSAGASLRVSRALLVAFDLTFARWSEFPSAAAAVTIDYNVGVLNSKIHLASPPPYPSPGFHDIAIPRLGVEWRALDRDRLGLDVRGGYSYEPTPAPDQLGESNLVDADKHTLSCGLGLELKRLRPVLSKSLSIDAHFSLTVLANRSYRKLDPLDAVGPYQASGVIPQLGLTLRSRF
jgi:long-chain fatty acid transport protein